MHKSCFLWLDKVEKVRDILRCLNGPHFVHFVNLLKHKEIRTFDILFLEIFNAGLTLLYCYAPALSLCHVLIFFSILPLCVLLVHSLFYTGLL